MDERSVHEATVDDVYEEQMDRDAVVDAATPLSEVVETLAFRSEIEAVYVVDTAERYLGVITRGDLLGWLEHGLSAPQARDGFPWEDLSEHVASATAEDALNPRSGEVPVEPREPLERALRGMLAGSLTVVPVVEASGDLAGELTLTRVLRWIVQDAGSYR